MNANDKNKTETPCPFCAVDPAHKNHTAHDKRFAGQPGAQKITRPSWVK